MDLDYLLYTINKIFIKHNVQYKTQRVCTCSFGAYLSGTEPSFIIYCEQKDEFPGCYKYVLSLKNLLQIIFRYLKDDLKLAATSYILGENEFPNNC